MLRVKCAQQLEMKRDYHVGQQLYKRSALVFAGELLASAVRATQRGSGVEQVLVDLRGELPVHTVAP
jgi:hypothetical protein